MQITKTGRIVGFYPMDNIGFLHVKIMDQYEDADGDLVTSKDPYTIKVFNGKRDQVLPLKKGSKVEINMVLLPEKRTTKGDEQIRYPISLVLSSIKVLEEKEGGETMQEFVEQWRSRRAGGNDGSGGTSTESTGDLNF